MIIILEGATGVGKTTLARKLSEMIGIGGLSMPVYRPFRHSESEHLRAHGDLALSGLPTNTWQEDMYVADVLAALKPNAILDRSLPSGLGYLLEREVARWPNQRDLDRLRWWVMAMARANAIMVHLHCPEDIRQARGARQGDWEPQIIGAIVRQAADLSQQAQNWYNRFHHYSLDTSSAPPGELVKLVHDTFILKEHDWFNPTAPLRLVS